MYTEDIIRKTAEYAALVSQGIFAYNLSGNYHRKTDGWSMQFSIVGVLSRDRAKRHAEAYLRSVHNATGIYFYQRSSDKENQFRAHFFRGDL